MNYKLTKSELKKVIAQMPTLNEASGITEKLESLGCSYIATKLDAKELSKVDSTELARKETLARGDSYEVKFFWKVSFGEVASQWIKFDADFNRK